MGSMSVFVVAMAISCSLLASSSSVRGIPLPAFLPFGPNYNDSSLPKSDDAFETVPLAPNIPFYGSPRNNITVQTDGRLELHFGTSVGSVLVFAADVDTRELGLVFFRESTDPDRLQDADDIAGGLSDILPDFDTSPPTSLFIATWYYVGHYNRSTDEINTFQCVLGTNGVQSFAMFLYADDLIEWTMGDRDDDPADIGFTHVIEESVYIPVSNTSDVINVATTSNIGIPGVWIFQIDSATITIPSINECALGRDNCDPNAMCIDTAESFTCVCHDGFTGDGVICLLDMGGGVSGSGSASDSASGGDFFEEASCVAAGYTSCCVVNMFDNCRVGVDDEQCFCDIDCYNRTVGSCCLDIAEAPCLPNLIEIGFSGASYMVGEDEVSAT